MSDYSERLQNLKDGFYRALQDRPLYPYKTEPGSISSSGVTECERKLWLKLVGSEDASFVPDNPDRDPDGSILQAQRGHHLESLNYHALEGEETGVRLVARPRFYRPLGDTRFKVTGLSDRIVEWPDGLRAVMDEKHMNAWRYLEFLIHGVKEAHPAYYAQIQYYMDAEGLDHGIIHGVSYDPAAVKTMVYRIQGFQSLRNIDYDPVCHFEWVEREEGFVEREDERLTRAVSRTAPADRTRDPYQKGEKGYESWECNPLYCEMREVCLGIGPCENLDCGHKQCEKERFSQGGEFDVK